MRRRSLHSVDVGKQEGGRTESSPIAARPPPRNYTVQVLTIEQEIKDHTQQIESGRQPCYAEACPPCAAQEVFRLHHRRRRSFRLVVEYCVRVFRSWVLRFKCANCQRTFTDYPPFRFSAQAICQCHIARAGTIVSRWATQDAQSGDPLEEVEVVSRRRLRSVAPAAAQRPRPAT